MSAILTIEQFRTLERYRITGHCAEVDAVTGEIILHGYRRYTPDGAFRKMQLEMCPRETQARLDAAEGVINQLRRGKA